MVSVITPTIRGKQALRPIEQCLREQTLQDFEWLIEFGDGKTHDLNAAFNRMLCRARGDLVVFWEDWQWVGPQGLEKFVQAYEAMPHHFFTAPVPKTDCFLQTRENDLLPSKALEFEWRSLEAGSIDWRRWEIDWGAAPLDPMLELGGFDEYMDSKWGNDNTNLAYRAHLSGWKFWNVVNNPAVGLAHDSLWPHPFRGQHDAEWSDERLECFKQGLKLQPLSNTRRSHAVS